MASIYELLGDSESARLQRVRTLVDHFYDVMDRAPEARALRAMHPADLTTSREKLTLFLLGWLGGPATYSERFGPPRLRARHLPFRVDDDGARQWMTCMGQALDVCIPEQALRDSLVRAFSRIALHMRNTEPPPA